MAEEAKGQRFSLQSGGRLGARIGNQGSTQTQGSTQSTGVSDTSGVQSSGVFLPGISNANIGAGSTVGYTGNREKMTYIASNELQGMGKKGVSEIQTPKTNITLPGITLKPLEQVNKEIDDKYKRIKAENTQLAFIDAQERNKQYGEQVNSEIGTQFEQGARQRWNNVKKAGKGAQSLLLERMAQIGYVNGAFGAMGTEEAKKKESEWINDARTSNLEYKKKINDGFKKWQKENVNQDLVKEYNGKTFSELITRGDMAGVKYKTIGMFADNISLLPNIVVTAINTPVGLTLMGSDTFIQESQNGFDEMIENGATYEEARNGAMWIGALNAGIEMAGEELFGIVGPASKGLRRLFLKNAVKEIEKNVTKKTLPEIILRAGGAQLKSALGEGGEEVLQEIVTNAFVNTVNKDKSLLDNLWQSFEGGAVMGLLIPGGALNSVTTDVQNNKIIDQKTDLEALDYVLEGEKRKAQRIEQQKEKMRQRANEKFQAQSGENAGLSDTNDYTEGRNVGGSMPASETTTEESVNTLDEGNVESDGSTFFSTDENGDYVVYDDGNGEQKIYAGSNSVTENGTKKSQFTELSDKTPYDPELEEYSKNFQRLVGKLSDPNVKGQDFVVIGRTEKGKEVRLSKQALKHIIEDHGKINVNTLLKAINKPTKQRWETKTDGKNRPYIVLDLGSKNKEFLVGLAPDSWTKNEDTAEYYTVTTSREAGAPKTPARDTRFQLKYEEEGYNPGVAGKNEKNISGKEGVNLRNKLNKKTVKELAEKYGIKVEVIEGMIKILENGKRKGYAYGKYIDQLLTLSEQIKESTAPHELLHAIFDMIDPETKTYLISQVMKSEGWSASKAEERLADSFSNFFRTGKIEGAPKSTWGKIKIFFKRVRSFINGMGKWRNQLEGIFTDIIESEGIEDLQGKIDRNERINKAKERMRERFKQYQKNAQKMQKKADKSKEKYQTVYHGSPYDFEKFDSANMGKGEGAQAHGWGHYVAVNERTGRHYAEMRGNGEWSYKGKTRTEIRDMVGLETPEEKQALRTMARMEEWGWSFDKAKNDQIKDYKEYIDKLNERIDRVKKGDHSIYDTVEQAQDELEKAKNELKILESLSESDFKKTTRNLYEVEIPDPVKANTPTGSNYLEEGKKPTRNQYEKFKNELEKYVKNYMPSRIVNLLDVKYEDLNGWGKANVGGGGGALYDIAGTVLGGDKQASKFLESLGYDGIHYFGGRDGEAYVIFNDDSLEITNHEKYQRADIDPEATSPEDLIEVNDKGLDVMVKFVSEKQKKNATDVSKEILTSDGKPYMWTSTNKYKSKVITDWRNVEDSKYKEYTDKGIQVARFTNNSSMSYSYADYKSKLAPVKKFKSIDELNKFFKENPNNYERILGNGIDDGVLKSSVIYEMKENDGKFELISNSTETLTQSMKDFYDGINNDWFGGNIGEMPENKDEALKKLQEYYNEHDYEIDGERTVKLLKNGNVERTVVKEPTVYKRFDTKLDALAEGYTIAQEADLYHYQGVIQKMKNPLVVDIRSKDNTPSTWSRLGTVNDIFDKEGINYNKEVDYYIRDVEEAMDGFSERMKALEQYWNDAYRDDPYGEVSQFMGNVQLSANNGVAYMVDELEDLLNDSVMGEDLKIGLDTEVYGDLRDYGRTLRDVITELRNFINTDRNYYALKKLSPEGIESWVKDMGAPKEVVKMIKNKNWKDMLGNWRDIGDKGWRENIKELLTTNGMDLETNDWVRYALDSGKYDGVIFKNIIDYGGLPKEGWENAKGGDVAVTFRSNQFKTWDNEDPTDSKYIRYQKMDDEYAEAVESGNTTRAKAILREYAKEKGYNSSTDYQGSLAFNGSAPASDGLTKEERVSGNEDIYSQTLGDFASDGLDGWDLERQLDPNGGLGVARARASRKLSGAEYDLESINNLRNAVMEYKKGNKDVKIRMYRAIDSDIKEEKFRNGDWITPSKEYAKHHIDLQDWKKGRVISEDVSIEDIRWDGNDINERGFDNEKEYGYKDTPNNRKELEITYDDNGNLIPLSERFNENVEDERYQRVYHGSSADFDRFDSSHMGEGEGDQAHGWGHYVAVEERTGRYYAEMGGGYGYDYSDNDNVDTVVMVNKILDDLNMYGGDVKDVIDSMREGYKSQMKGLPEEMPLRKGIQKEIDTLNSIDIKKFKTGKRHLYEIEIPDPEKADTPTGWNYWEETDKKLSTKELNGIMNELSKKKTKGAERVKNAVDYDLEDGDKISGKTMLFNLRAGLGDKKASKFLESLGYVGIHYFGGRDGEAYVIFDDNDLEIKNHEKYQVTEYEYDENGNPKWIKFGDNSEFDPSIFGENTKEEQIEEDKENEKNNPFYDAWIKYNNQNYKDDQITLAEFMDAIGKWGEKQQDEYDQKMRDIAEAENDPKMLELQLKAVKLMEKEQNVGKKFGKNVSKEVRDRQQKEVEKEREELVKEIFDWVYPGLKFEDATYDDMKMADEKEADWEMLGRGNIEEKLKFFKKDKNGNWEKKNIKIENPNEKLDKIVKSGNFDEIIEPTDRVIEWKTPEGQKGRIDKAKDPKKFKSVMEKINSGKTKTKVELKDVTNEVRALERYKENEKAEKERRKKEKQEEFAKKKQEEYKRMVRMKAFQRLVDMQRFEKYPFLTEEEIKNRYGFNDQEWKTITEQEEIKLPKKWGEKAISDFNKAVDDQVKYLIEGLNWQNNMKMREAEKNLGEIGEIDIDVLLGKDEEKGAREVEEFEKLAKEGKEETGGEKIEEGKTAWEKDMEKKNEKAKKQAEKLTKKWKEDVSDMFRKAEEKRNERYANKEEKVIDEVKTVEEAKEITKESRWKRTKKFWKDTTIQDLIQPISSRIEKISPRIYLELMRFEQRVAVKTNTRMKQIEDFVKKMSEIRSKNKKDYLNITLHLLNGNVGTANKMLEKYGTSIPRQVLDEIWADAEDVGYTMNYEGFYYPRKVKDVQDFLDRFARTENKDIQGEIDKIIKKKEEQARKRGEEFTPQMKADLINQLLMEGEVEGISLGSGHMKQRKVESITKNMLEFYEDPVDALLQYITSMTEAVEKARFLGQGTRGEIKTLGEFITDEGITGSDVDELKDLLLSRFNYAPMGNFMRGLKVSANIIHLGSPSSALSQLADISFSLIENGLTNLVQGLANRYNLDLDALGITNRGEELKTQGKNETKREKVQRFTFKMTGFNMMDQFGKKSFVVSTLNKLIKYAKRNDPQLRKDLERWFDDPKMINEIIEDLKEGRMSENVNLFLFTKLADVQPLTRTQMPKTYLQAGNWRVLYAFKTFGIKQLDYLIQTSKRELATKPTAKALWTITAMLGIIMLCGAGTDEIKDFTLGRKSSSWIWRMIEGNDWSVSQMSDRFWDNLLKLVGMTKYSIYQARTQGIKSAIEDIFFSLPGLDIVTYPLQDIQEAMSEDGLDFSQASSWQLLPIVGKYGYWWAGAGQTKQQKALEKEKKKAEKENSKTKTKKKTKKKMTKKSN